MTKQDTSCVLAFDYGSRIIGVAIGNRLTNTARALTTVANTGAEPNWPCVDALIAQWRPGELVIGLPLTLEGQEQTTSRAARRFAEALRQRYARPVHTVDERYTSREASHRFAEQRALGTARRKDAAALDALAAQIILETWLSSIPTKNKYA